MTSGSSSDSSSSSESDSDDDSRPISALTARKSSNGTASSKPPSASASTPGTTPSSATTKPKPASVAAAPPPKPKPPVPAAAAPPKPVSKPPPFTKAPSLSSSYASSPSSETQTVRKKACACVVAVFLYRRVVVRLVLWSERCIRIGDGIDTTFGACRRHAAWLVLRSNLLRGWVSSIPFREDQYFGHQRASPHAGRKQTVPACPTCRKQLCNPCRGSQVHLKATSVSTATTVTRPPFRNCSLRMV
jgi:hypothetical protein